MDDPAPYDVLVICLASSVNTVYSPAEVSRIVDFVSAGGGLLLLGDNTDTPNQNIQPIASAFGVSLGESYIHPPDVFTTDLAPHPIFAGINRIYLRAAGEISAVTPSTEVAWQEGTGLALVAVGSYGQGRVVTIGDVNFADARSLSSADNLQFSLNVFQYLTIPEPAGSVLAMGCLMGTGLVLRRIPLSLGNEQSPRR